MFERLRRQTPRGLHRSATAATSASTPRRRRTATTSRGSTSSSRPTRSPTRACRRSTPCAGSSRRRAGRAGPSKGPRPRGSPGPRALVNDLKTVTQQDERQMYFLVTLGVYVILVLLLRRPGICLYLIVTVVLGYLASLGMTELVFQALHTRARPLGRARLEGGLLPLRDPRGRGRRLQHLPDVSRHRGGAQARDGRGDPPGGRAHRRDHQLVRPDHGRPSRKSRSTGRSRRPGGRSRTPADHQLVRPDHGRHVRLDAHRQPDGTPRARVRPGPGGPARHVPRPPVLVPAFLVLLDRVAPETPATTSQVAGADVGADDEARATGHGGGDSPPGRAG